MHFYDIPHSVVCNYITFSSKRKLFYNANLTKHENENKLGELFVLILIKYVCIEACIIVICKSNHVLIYYTQNSYNKYLLGIHDFFSIIITKVRYKYKFYMYFHNRNY